MCRDTQERYRAQSDRSASAAEQMFFFGGDSFSEVYFFKIDINQYRPAAWAVEHICDVDLFTIRSGD